LTLALPLLRIDVGQTLTRILVKSTKANNNFLFLKFLSSFIFRLVQLDSWVTREEFLETSTTLEQMDLDDEKEDSDSTKAAQTMDVMMCTMLELCSDKFRDGQTFETQRVLYQQVYSAFESLILPAFGIHHAHFLMFYVCSKKPTFHESFVERLWAVFQNPSSPLNIRKASADYLASFLGKASFVPIK
jgi:hypothetical protein